jgi:hypothetical protein
MAKAGRMAFAANVYDRQLLRKIRQLTGFAKTGPARHYRWHQATREPSNPLPTAHAWPILRD